MVTVNGISGTCSPHNLSTANCAAPANTNVLIARIEDSPSPVYTAARPKATPKTMTKKEMGSSDLKPSQTSLDSSLYKKLSLMTKHNLQSAPLCDISE